MTSIILNPKTRATPNMSLNYWCHTNIQSDTANQTFTFSIYPRSPGFRAVKSRNRVCLSLFESFSNLSKLVPNREKLTNESYMHGAYAWVHATYSCIMHKRGGPGVLARELCFVTTSNKANHKGKINFYLLNEKTGTDTSAKITP